VAGRRGAAAGAGAKLSAHRRSSANPTRQQLSDAGAGSTSIESTHSARLQQFFDQIEVEVRAAPGVADIGWSSAPPLGESLFGDDYLWSYEIVGDAPVEDARKPTASFQIGSPSYFSTLDLPIVAGRAFDARPCEQPEGRDRQRGVCAKPRQQEPDWPAGVVLIMVRSKTGRAEGRLISAMLFGGQPLDVATFALVVVVLGLTTAIAIAGPTWRAARIDPAKALRSK
jgi:hypothetical protein